MNVFCYFAQLLCIIAEEEGDVAAFKDFEDTGEIEGAESEPTPPPPETQAVTPKVQ